jgi:hypothetical protein
VQLVYLKNMSSTMRICGQQQRLSMPRALGSALPCRRLCRSRLIVTANAAKDPNAPIQSNPLGALSSQTSTTVSTPSRSEEARKYFRTVSDMERATFNSMKHLVPFFQCGRNARRSDRAPVLASPSTILFASHMSASLHYLSCTDGAS